MTRNTHYSMAGTRQLIHDLQELGRVQAPPSLLASVVVRTGLGDAYARLDTAIGQVFVAYNKTGISALMRAEDAARFEDAFRARFGRPAHAVTTLPKPFARAVADRLNGGGDSLPHFDLRGLSEFERLVLLKTLEIPRGEVRPYGWIAKEIGRPRAIRAVGTALGNNPVPLLIPCHRVVYADSSIGDYIFGHDAKRAVLAAEGAAPEILEDLARSGVRYYADDTSGMYCLPTCGGEHLRDDPHRVALRSEREAIRAGYRPCTVCRPAVAYS